MSRYVLEGKFRHIEDKLFVETEEQGMNGFPTEVCLNDLIKGNVAEESEITIVINVKNK